MLEKSAPGGQAGHSSKIENYLGFPTGISGSDLAQKAIAQAQKFGVRISTPGSVKQLKIAENAAPEIEIENGGSVRAQCVIIASGVRYRRPPALENERFDGQEIYYAATQMEAQMCENSEAVIVGGGNSAGQAAVFLSDHAKTVHICIRGADLSSSMSRYLIARIEQIKNIVVHPFHEVRELHGDASLERVTVENTASGEKTDWDCAALFVFIGASPNTDWLPDEIARDENGFVLTGKSISDTSLKNGWKPSLLETNVPGIYAVGDVRSGSTKRVASAVGEGSMAVGFVHEHLASKAS